MLNRKKQVRHFLLWIENKCLQIYNTATWTNAVDKDQNKNKSGMPVGNSIVCPTGYQGISRCCTRDESEDSLVRRWEHASKRSALALKSNVDIWDALDTNPKAIRFLSELTHFTECSFL